MLQKEEYEYKYAQKALLNPNYFNNEVFWLMLGKKAYTKSVEKSIKQIPDHKWVVASDGINFYLDWYLLRTTLSYLPDIDECILEACLDDDFRKELWGDLRSKTLRAVLNPTDFDNETFWWSLKGNETIKTDDLHFFNISVYHKNGKDWLCYYPELLEVIVKSDDKFSDGRLRLLLENCVITQKGRDSIEDAYRRLSTIRPDSLTSADEPLVRYNDILGRDSIDGLCYSYYLKVLAAILTAGLGIGAIVVSVMALSATSFAPIGVAVMALGVASIVTAGFFYKSAYEANQQPSAVLLKP